MQLWASNPGHTAHNADIQTIPYPEIVGHRASTAYLGKMYVNGLEITHFREIKGKAWPVQVQIITLFTVACTGGSILHLWDTPTVANCVVISYTLNTRTKIQLPVIITILKKWRGLCSLRSQPCLLSNPRLDQFNA